LLEFPKRVAGFFQALPMAHEASKKGCFPYLASKELKLSCGGSCRQQGSRFRLGEVDQGAASH
jgi:hypothetical protein